MREGFSNKPLRGLEFFMKRDNLTEKDIAEIIGVHEHSVRSWLSFDSGVEQDNLIKLMFLFELDAPDPLYDPDGCMPVTIEHEGRYPLLRGLPGMMRRGKVDIDRLANRVDITKSALKRLILQISGTNPATEKRIAKYFGTGVAQLRDTESSAIDDDANNANNAKLQIELPINVPASSDADACDSDNPNDALAFVICLYGINSGGVCRARVCNLDPEVQRCLLESVSSESE